MTIKVKHLEKNIFKILSLGSGILNNKPFYPFLFAIFPAVFLYSENINELLPKDVVLAFCLMLGSSFLLFLILKRIFKKPEKAAMVVFLIFLFLFTYVHIHNQLPDFTFNFLSAPVGKDKVLFPLFLLISVMTVFFGLKKDPTKLTKVLNTTALFLLIVPVLTIGSYEVRSQRIFGLVKEPKVGSSSETLLKKPVNPPDIYYLIFDRYASIQTLKEYFNYENKDFVNFLNKNGFYVAQNSRDNYPTTFLSLASSLNLDYINSLLPNLPENSGDRTKVYQLIADFKIQQYLKPLGYKYINVGSWWTPTRQNRNADKNYIFSPSKFLSLDEFATKLVETSAFSPIIQLASKSDLDEPFENFDHRNRIRYGFDSLKKIPNEIAGPKFVFGHVLIPHAPFVLNQECQSIKLNPEQNQVIAENYLNQLRCGNKNIIEVVEKILSSPRGNNSIIILQADEGPNPIINKYSSQWHKSNAAALREKTGILNAYYFPNKDYQHLYQTITPVNSFRIIFNMYFGSNFEYLNDKIYMFPDSDTPYQLHDVTSKVK